MPVLTLVLMVSLHREAVKLLNTGTSYMQIFSVEWLISHF